MTSNNNNDPRGKILKITAPHAQVMLLYGPASRNSRQYCSDIRFFASHQLRSHLLRRAGADEYGQFEAALAWDKPAPDLWVHVVKTSEETYVCYSVWRGKAFFEIDAEGYAAVGGDSAIHMLLEAMGKMNGFDPAAFVEYALAKESAIAAYDAQHNQGNGKVH